MDAPGIEPEAGKEKKIGERAEDKELARHGSISFDEMLNNAATKHVGMKDASCVQPAGIQCKHKPNVIYALNEKIGQLLVMNEKLQGRGVD